MAPNNGVAGGLSHSAQKKANGGSPRCRRPGRGILAGGPTFYASRNPVHTQLTLPCGHTLHAPLAAKTKEDSKPAGKKGPSGDKEPKRKQQQVGSSCSSSDPVFDYGLAFHACDTGIETSRGAEYFLFPPIYEVPPLIDSLPVPCSEPTPVHVCMYLHLYPLYLTTFPCMRSAQSARQSARA